MLVRKIIESYERGVAEAKSTVVVSAPARSLRVPRAKRPSLRIVTEDDSEPAASVHVSPPPSSSRALLRAVQHRADVPDNSNVLSPKPATAILTPDTSHTFGYPNPTSIPSTLPSTLPRAHSTSASGPFQSRANTPCIPTSSETLKARRLERYEREEAALRISLQRTRPSPSAHALQVAQLELTTAMFDARARDTKARLEELRALLATPEESAKMESMAREDLLKRRWMDERWVVAAEQTQKAAEQTQNVLERNMDSLLATKENQSSNSSSTLRARKEANLAKFFARSPTTTSALPRRRRMIDEEPRRISHRDVEPYRLRTWPLDAYLRRPLNIGSLSFNLPVPVSPTTSSTPRRSPKRPSPIECPLPPVIELEVSPPTTTSAAFPGSRHTATATNRSSTASSLSSSEWPPSGYATIFCVVPRSHAEILADASPGFQLPDYVAGLLADFSHIKDDITLPLASDLTSKQLQQRQSMDSYESGVLVARPSADHYEYEPEPKSFRRSFRLSISGRAHSPNTHHLQAIREDSEGHSSPSRSIRHRPSLLRHRLHHSEERSSSTPTRPRTPPRPSHRLADAETPTKAMDRMRKRMSNLGRAHK
ncbi:hypothetical protein FA95DRAFT_873827 [Auriscalpium vulgare]|uniref:Uncharacterized protein n=1 Tax=Auriscalpium vulgare TaxID=40419 RepID=A0ACB8S0P7_9AGAM|nr:hypothetical protein FA95DRAFT_873827 [Auriscalpium vulgare]